MGVPRQTGVGAKMEARGYHYGYQASWFSESMPMVCHILCGAGWPLFDELQGRDTKGRIKEGRDKGSNKEAG